MRGFNLAIKQLFLKTKEPLTINKDISWENTTKGILNVFEKLQ